MEGQNISPTGHEESILIPAKSAFSGLKRSKKGRVLTAKYMTVEDWQKEKGKEKFCYFLGFKETSGADGEAYYMAKLHDGTTPFVAAQSVLVQSLMSTPIGQGVSVTCTDVIKNNKNGKTALFRVIELDVNLILKSNG